ncbi:MAG TPA: ROK family transcriptional regulator [Actinocrinis sp.]|nr:ROK family transcriptional regulator [Actinocrinis sp.]
MTEESAWNRTVLRINNERLLLGRLRADGATSRAELARITGLSKPTVSTALGRLERAGLVREVGKVANAGRGRSPVLYEADPTAGYAMGIDIGRSWVRAAVADLNGVVLGRGDERNQADDADALVAIAGTLARRAAAEAGLEWSSVLHTVVGSPGVTDSATHAVRYADNLPGWGRRGATDLMQRELGTGLEVVNDANLAALGEYSVGAGQGCELFVYLLVGTGIGAGIVAGGKLFLGAHGAAGEVGYLPWGADGGGAGDGNGADSSNSAGDAPTRGMLEDAAAGDAVLALAHGSGLTEAGSAKDVFDAARAGSARALVVVGLEAERLAHAVAAVAAVIDPALVVLGGGIGDNADLLLEPLRAALQRITPLRPELVPSQLGGDAVLRGAIATAVTAARERAFEAWNAG